MQMRAGGGNYDPLAARIAAQFGSTVCSSWDDPEFADERYALLRAYRRKYGLAHVLSTALPEPELGLGHFLSLFRSDPARPWTEAERRLKERLFPHLTEAFMQARCLHMKPEGGAERCHVIADHALLVANITPLFRELMLREWPGWTDSRMPPEVCATWSGDSRSYYKGSHIVIGMEPDQQLVHLTVRARNAFDVLSAQELAVARLFAQGLGHKEIAKERNVSPHTVRNQIKAIYTKLCVNNKTSLAACLEDLS
jgi:DNA-binding CsgD family transcriptional regulator